MQQSWGQDVKADTLVIADSANPSLQVAEGVASYYHNKFEGRLMANGAVFSQTRLTAAHNTLPLNTWVQVTNLSNGKTVVVKITDRMHPKNKRLIDLSRAAAIRLGYIRKGLTRVKVVPLGLKRPLEADLQ
ncbi:MAG: septal ring lytic transglycosylase RlpA family protein [Chitinophagaceae bacterium]